MDELRRLHETKRRVRPALDGRPLTRKDLEHTSFGNVMRIILCTAAVALLAGSALAQAPAPATPSAQASKATTAKTMTTVASKPKEPQKPRTAASLQCSKDADAKNIHGKPRKAFMSSCKKAAGKS